MTEWEAEEINTKKEQDKNSKFEDYIEELKKINRQFQQSGRITLYYLVNRKI